MLSERVLRYVDDLLVDENMCQWTAGSGMAEATGERSDA